MTPDVAAAVRRHHDFAVAAIGVEFELSMDEVRAIVFPSGAESQAKASEGKADITAEAASDGDAIRPSRAGGSPATISENVMASAALPGFDGPAAADGEHSAASGATESVPALQRAFSEAVVPSSDESATGREVVASALPASNTPGESGTAREASGGSAPSDGIASLKEGPQAAPRTNSPETAPESTAARKDGQQAGNGRDGNSESARAEEDDSLGARSQPTWKERVGQAVDPAGTQAPPVDTNSPATAIQAPEPALPGLPVPLRTEAATRKDAGAPAPGPTLKDRILACHKAHPDWDTHQIAEAVGAKANSVSAYKSMLDLPIPARTTDSRLPTAIDIAVPRPTLKTRVAAAHAEHPDFSLTALAAHMGSDPGPISKVAKQLGITFPKAVRPPPPRRDDSIAARVEAYVAEHPEAVTGEIAKALGIKASSVRVAELSRGLTIRKLTPEERSEVQRAAYERSVETGNVAASPRKFVRPEEVPNATQAQFLAKAPAVALPEEDGEESPRRKYGEEPTEESRALVERPADEQDIHPSVVKFGSPTTKWFRLRRADGLWLHLSGAGFTENRNDGWIGKIGQLRAARERFPDAKGLQIVGVSAKPTPI